MLDMELFPPELLYHIWSFLDRETMLMVSQVCRRWRLLIHELAYQYIKNFHQLTKGMTQDKHELNSCKCVEIFLDCYPHRNLEAMAVSEEKCEGCETFQPTCAITDNHIIVAKTLSDNEFQSTTVIAFDRINVKEKPVQLVTFNVSFGVCFQKITHTQKYVIFQDSTEVHIYSHSDTLVILERRAVENMITSIIRIGNFKVSIWNAKTLDFVREVDFLSKIDDLPYQENVHTEISDIAVVSNHLAVHVFVTNLDWLLPHEIVDNPQSMNLTLFWSLDSNNPNEDLIYKTSVKKSLVEADICDTGFILLNERFFCRYLSGIFSKNNAPKFGTKIQVFSVNELETCKPWIVEINDSDVIDFEDCNEDSVKLESGKSKRLAAFNVYKRLFKIVDIEASCVIMKIDFRNSFKNFSLGRRSFTAWQLYDCNWSLGRFIFINETNKVDKFDKKTFQVIIVTEEENEKDHLLNLPNFLIGNTVDSNIDKTEMIVPSNRLHVDMRGLVIVTEDFLLHARFL